MAAANNNQVNELTHITGIIHAIRQELGCLRTEMTLRFDQADSTAAALRRRIDEIDHNFANSVIINQIRDDAAASRNTLGDINQNITTVEKAFNSRIERAEVAINQATRDAVERSQRKLDDRLEQTKGDINRVTKDTIQEAQRQNNDRIEQAEEKINDKTKDLTQHVQRRINERLEQTKRDITQAVENESQRVDQQVDERLRQAERTIGQTTNDSFRDTFRVVLDKLVQDREAFNQTINNVTGASEQRLIDLVKERLEAIALELRAGHFNHAARLANKFASCCNNSISVMRGVENQRLANFPATYSDFYELRGEINDILIGLGLSPHGTLPKKQQRLKTYLGLRK